MIKSTQEIEMDLTPAIIAKAFWGMGSDEQAEFFERLHDEVDNTVGNSAYSHGEMQWLYMRDAITERGSKARNMYLALSAFAYDFWPLKSEFDWKVKENQE